MQNRFTVFICNLFCVLAINLMPNPARAEKYVPPALGIALASTLYVGTVYGLSRLENGNQYLGAIWLVPSAFGPHRSRGECGKWCEASGYTLWGTFMSLSILNFAVWQPRYTNKDELFFNNVAVLGAGLGLSFLIGSKDGAEQVALVPELGGARLIARFSF